MASARSLYLYQKTSKIDLENLKKNDPFKYKIDYLTLVFVLISIGLVVGGFFIPFLFMFSLFTLVFAFVFYRRYTNKKIPRVLDHVEKYNMKLAKEMGGTPVSSVYPAILFCDNQKKELRLVYQDIEYLNVSYSNVKKYNIYVDRVRVNGHLPKNPDKKAASYVLEIVFDNDKSVEIGFSNTNRYFILGRGFSYLQFANTRSVNFLATVLERIIHKNNV